MTWIGFPDKTIKWFYSYLTDRAFYISRGTVFLEAGTINCGVLQGPTRLGPLILLYNIPQVLSNTYTYLYANDTSIFYQH